MNMACLHLFSAKISFVRILKFSPESSVSFIRLLPWVPSFSACHDMLFLITFSIVIAAGEEGSVILILTKIF